jgi:hypothetical protein
LFRSGKIGADQAPCIQPHAGRRRAILAEHLSEHQNPAMCRSGSHWWMMKRGVSRPRRQKISQFGRILSTEAAH